MGFRPVRSLVQTEALDEETRIELWNCVLVTFRAVVEEEFDSGPASSITSSIWAWEFKKPRDEQPSDTQVWGQFKQRVLSGEWFDVLDLIEAYLRYLTRFATFHSGGLVPATVDALNNVFESNLVGYRVIDSILVPLDSRADAEAVSEAVESSGDFGGARTHLQRAAELLSDRKTPDYPNSIKESISAVEAVVRKVTKEGTLGAGLKKLQAGGIAIHPALEGAWSKMYGWTSDANGIRHAAVEPSEADQAIAKYMLVTCSAFVSYLIEAGRKGKFI